MSARARVRVLPTCILINMWRCILFLDFEQEGKAVSGAVGRLRDPENATEKTETDQKEKEKGSQRTAKVSSRQIIIYIR